MPMTMLATVLLAAGALGQDFPAAMDAYGAFGFPNVTGTEIIVLHDVPRADELRTAVCGGRTFAIRFVRRQPVIDADRDVPEQFDRLDGTVFRLLEQGVTPEDTCVVVTEALLKDAEVLPVHASSSPVPCAEDEQHRFGALRARRIKGCWSLAAVEPQGIVGVAEYVRVGRDALASLIVASSERGILLDFPAKYDGDGQDRWRVDDAGEFAPEGFAVPFIIRRGGTYFIPVAWGGSEGISLAMFESDPDAPARRVISDYWYRSPR
jgi:hypothetical protein